MITIGTPNFNTYKFSFILSYRTIDTISSIPYTKPHSEKEGDKKKEEKEEALISSLYWALQKHSRSLHSKQENSVHLSLYVHANIHHHLYNSKHIIH